MQLLSVQSARSALRKIAPKGYRSVAAGAEPAGCTASQTRSSPEGAQARLGVHRSSADLMMPALA